VISRVFRAAHLLIATLRQTKIAELYQRQRFGRCSGLVRDNGSMLASIANRRYLDFEFDFSRSVPLQLNSYSFVSASI